MPMTIFVITTGFWSAVQEIQPEIRPRLLVERNQPLKRGTEPT